MRKTKITHFTKNGKLIFKQFFIVLSFLSMVGCVSSYHELANDQNPEYTLGSDGVLIGIEKFAWDKVNKEKGLDTSRYKIDEKATKSTQLLREQLDGVKVMIVSHILEYKKGERTNPDFYNPFVNKEGNDIDEEDADLKYEQGYVVLDKLKDKIKNDLKGENYTHVIFMSMGWHNDQYESIKRYKKIITEIEYRDSTNEFNPYIVAITWPSSWASNSNIISEMFGHFGSYPNKANDTDEIGFTLANYLLHNVILSAVNEVNSNELKIKTIGIGHSMGARLISRAIFSKNYLKNDKSNGTSLDLFIGLQPAFSANRFIANGGKEGSPYKEHSKIKTKFLITSSKLDEANPIAIWSEHIGGKDGYDTVEENLEAYNFHTANIVEDNIVKLDIKDLWQSDPNKKVEFIDCQFIKCHNDILDDEMGLFLYEMIVNSGI